ncbi:hypothetical protein LOK49_LG02G02022 [Camellia lanceoleosa]|uniref:Uncharacterized protein n=1 Tax=Camellia lanceoleosa TaxID=1840588 RepID=A0ACC0IQW9_9ERIC|nr:hypothetical protein LOK49_LG02G02022 [Camellia lanceoleosa]
MKSPPNPKKRKKQDQQNCKKIGGEIESVRQLLDHRSQFKPAENDPLRICGPVNCTTEPPITLWSSSHGSSTRFLVLSPLNSRIQSNQPEDYHCLQSRADQDSSMGWANTKEYSRRPKCRERVTSVMTWA